MSLTGKTSIITGGSDGIGRAIAAKLASEGAHVVICARNAEKLESVAEDIEAAGGYTLDARKKYITIIRPNGDVSVKDSFSSPKVEEGALIIVHKKRQELPFNITAFFKDTASIAASLTTIIYIINTQNN